MSVYTGKDRLTNLLIWVTGCAAHYLRWVICRDAKQSKDCCHCVEVVDAPRMLVQQEAEIGRGGLRVANRQQHRNE